MNTATPTPPPIRRTPTRTGSTPAPMPARLLLPLLLLALPALLTTRTCAQSPLPVSERLDAIVAHPLVIALRVTDEQQLRHGVITRLDDGRTFETEPYWVGLVPYHTLPGWVTPAGRWEAIPYEQARLIPREQRPPGSWFTLIPLPVDAVGQGLWFGTTRYELNWLPDPERSLLEAGGDERSADFARFWSMRLDERALRDPVVARAIELLSQDPFQYWRARLLTDGLDPDRTRARETLAHAQDPIDALELQLDHRPPGTELLNAIARQQEARWQIILGRIWLIDPDTAERLKRALMRTARFGDRTLPVWGLDATDLAQLAHDLLSPFVNDDTRVLRAKAWLETRPRAIAWVIDDQGTLEAGSQRLLPTIGVVSLPRTPGDSMLRADAHDDSPILRAVPPDTLQTIRMPVEQTPVTLDSPQLNTRRLDLRLGNWSRSLQVLTSPVPATAPFVRIGPLLADWNMSALVNNRPMQDATLPPERACAGMLWRTGTPDRGNPRTGWRLFLECASPDPLAGRDAVTVWIGPRDLPAAAWRITPDALVETIAGTRYGTVPQPSVETRILSDRWVAQIDLPEAAFDDDGQLMIGIERTDPDGVHSAWPRRMIPGQDQPARLIILPDRFDALSAP